MPVQHCKSFTLMFGLLMLSISVCAQSPLPAKQEAVIQAEGPHTNPRFFNVEGKANTKYAGYGVLRFEGAKLKQELDKKYGTGKYKITEVHLELMQSPAKFSKDGSLNVYFTPDNKTALDNGSPLKYPYNPQGVALTGQLLGASKFVKTDAPALTKSTTGGSAATSNPKTDSMDLGKGSGSDALKGALAQGKTVTLVLEEADASVAATYAGIQATGAHQAPQLVVKVLPGK